MEICKQSQVIKVYNFLLENMKNKLVCLLLVIGLVVSWIYLSLTLKVNNPALITLLKVHGNFVNDPIIKPADGVCKGPPFLLILVTSYVGHVELRSAHRRSMPEGLLRTMNIVRVFLLAKIPEKEKYIDQRSIEDENNTFQDILQGSFTENYRNLTLKHLMGLQWASTVCHQAKFLLKVDDDTVFSLEQTYKLLNNQNLEKTMLGYMLNNTTPKRNKQNKWYVTRDEYPRNDYPPYLSGWYYITTPKIAGMLCDEAMIRPKFWIDDILITGLLPESLNSATAAGIKLKQLPKNYWLEYYELLECCINDMLKNNILCEYVVGPNGGRNNLIYEYNEAIRNCENRNNCTKRPTDKPLKKSCVTYRDRSIYSDGKAEVYHLKL